MFLDGDVGPISTPNYWANNFSGFRAGPLLAFIHNPANAGSTPVGISFIAMSPLVGSQRLTFQWYSGPASPASDAARYALMSSGQIKPDEFPSLSDTRFLLASGPSRIKPSTDPNPDTLIWAVAVVSGQDLSQLQTRALRARDLYQNVVLNVGDDSRPLPGGFRLNQNYPNPFNPTTTISYTLSAKSRVELRVYDVLGREVVSLVSQEMTAGAHSVRWNAAGFPSGIYYYRLVASSNPLGQAGNFTQTKKLVLLR